ncbi:MAG: hypothetical protein ACYDBQ_09810 [Thermoplasmatota archaeon]
MVNPFPSGTGTDQITVIAAATPRIVHRGESFTVCAAAFHDGPHVFVFASCPYPASEDDHGQSWNCEGPGVSMWPSPCPATNATHRWATLAAGDVERWERNFTIPDGWPQGPFRFNVTFHERDRYGNWEGGGDGQEHLVYVTGKEGGAPAITVTPNRTSILPGEQIDFTTNVSNPTQQSFRYVVGCQVRTFERSVANSAGRTVTTRPVQPGYCPDWEHRLSPGDCFVDHWAWNGIADDASRPHGTLVVHAVFFDDDYLDNSTAVGTTTVITEG